jgi:hypothetical protein
MAVSVDELTQARETVYRVLDALHVDAYIFEVEPHNENWEIIVECAISEGWSRVRLTAPRQTLLASKAADTTIPRSLYETWRNALSACKRRDT